MGLLDRAVMAGRVLVGMGPYVDQEFSVTQDSLLKRFELSPYSPDDLITKKRFAVYEKMMVDDHIASCMDAIKTMLLAGGYEWVAAGPSPQDEEIKDFVASVLEHMETPFYDVLWSLASAQEFGWYLGELNWTEAKTGPWAGKYVMTSIKAKRQSYFNLVMDDFDNIIKVVSISPPSYGHELPLDKFLVYSYRKRWENAFGTARLRSLYQWWWIKQVMVRAMGVYMEKFGVPIPVGKYDPRASKDVQDKLLGVLKHLRFEHAIIAPKGSEIDLVEAAKNGPEGFLRIIEHADKKISQTILGQTLTMDAGRSGGLGGLSGGSSAGGRSGLGGIHMDVLGMYVEQLGRDIAEKPVAAAVKRLVDANFSGVVAYPALRFKDPRGEEEGNTQSVQTYISAVMAGAVAPIDEDDAHIREVLGFPTTAADEKGMADDAGNAPVPIHLPAPEPVKSVRQLPMAGYHGPSGMATYAETFKPRRKLTPYEAHVDFSEAIRSIERDGVQELVPKLGKTLRAAVDATVRKALRSGIVSEKQFAAVNRLTLPGRGDLNVTFLNGLKSIARDGMRDVRAEIRSRRKGQHADAFDIQLMTPDEVIQFLRARAYKATDRVQQDVLDRIKNRLLAGIKNGQSDKDVAAAVEKDLQPYFVEGAIDDDRFSGPRLETAVRTIASEAYNEGRKSIMTDPDLQGVVPAMQYSAILDDRVRPNHAAMDGLIYPVESPYWDELTPPAGFNCRCMLIPVTSFDEYEVSPAPTREQHPDEGFN